MLARNALTRSSRGFRMKFPSVKLGRMVECESLLEADAVRLLEFSPGVLSFQEQPAHIHYWDGENMRDYYPDFQLNLSDGRLVYLEIKRSEELATLALKNKFSAIARHYAESGKHFRIATEQEIRKEPLQTNLRRLGYHRGHVPLRWPSSVQLTLELGVGPITLSRAEQLLGPKMTWRLLAHGHLECDLNLSITPETNICVSQGGNRETVLL